MLKSKLNQLRASEGFTIIEVIIVLVIAAIIMLMVFLIVPQLQRTQRNSRRQNDGRRLLTAGEQLAANADGVYSTTTITSGKLENITGKIVNPSDNTNMTVTVTDASSNFTAPTTWALGTVVVYPGASCNTAKDNVVGGSGKVAVLMPQEVGSGSVTAVCYAI